MTEQPPQEEWRAINRFLKRLLFDLRREGLVTFKTTGGRREVTAEWASPAIRRRLEELAENTVEWTDTIEVDLPLDNGSVTFFEPGDEAEYDDAVQDFVHAREPIPHHEETRRGLLWGLTVAFGIVFVLQLGFALALNGDTWARVGPILTTATTLVGTGFGFGWGFYFSYRD